MGKEKIKIIIGICISILLSACSDSTQKQQHYSRNDIIEYNKKLVRLDSALVVAYSDTAGLNVKPTDGGLWITIHKEGNGELLNMGDIVSLNYSIKTLLGQVYYSSDADGLKTFTIGSSSEPSGLSEALITMRHGTSATLILVPDKAFGLIGDDNKIVGRQILRYDFTVQ